MHLLTVDIVCPRLTQASPGNQTYMGDAAVLEVMDEMEQRAEERIGLLNVLENAEMMSVTREAIVSWIEEERFREREMFGALGR